MSGLALRRRCAANLFANILATESQFLGLRMATRTDDEIKQDDAGFFAYDPMGCVGKRCFAMLTDPCHVRRLSKAYASLRFVVDAGRKWILSTHVAHVV